MLFMVMDKMQGRMYLVQADHKYHARRRVRDLQLAEMSNKEREKYGFSLVDMDNLGVSEIIPDQIDLVEVNPTWVDML